MSHVVNITGQRFNRLVALRKTGSKDGGKAVWLFKCDCGFEKDLLARDVRNGKIQSCGCLRKEVVGALSRRHGYSRLDCPEYAVWKRMRQRCNDVNASDYAYYGGRGIKVCERWNDFTLFLSDMGARPTSEHTIERKIIH